MKMEFLASGSPDCPILRLFDFDRPQACRLREAVGELASGTVTAVDLDEVGLAEPVGGCRLVLKVGRTDQGVVRGGPTQFFCVLTSEAWSNVEGLTEPFCESADPRGLQWLDEHSDVSLLLSPTGRW